MGSKLSIEQIFDDFVPVKDRSWYPWVWPEREWFIKTKRDNPHEYLGFLEKIRKLAHNDYFFFCDEIMRPPDDPRKPHLDTELHGELCHVINCNSDIVILIPRGHLKTTIGTVNYSIWEIGKDPSLRLLLASDVKDIAQKFLFEIKQNIESNPRLSIVFPNLKPAKSKISHTKYQKWNENEIVIERPFISKEPTLTAVGTNQTITGNHYDGSTYDDIMTEKSAFNDEGSQNVYRLYQSSLPLLNPGARKLLIGTKYGDNDIYSMLEEQGELQFYVLSAIEDGRYIWNKPEMIEHVEKMRRELSDYIFACQFMNDPIIKGEQEFQPDWIKEYEQSEIDKLQCNVFLGCDPNRAQKKRSWNDFCVIMAVGVDLNENIYVYDFYRGKPTSSLDITKLYADWFEKWNPIKAKIEVYGGDAHLLEPIRKELLSRNLTPHRFSGFNVNSRFCGDDIIRAMQIYFQKGKVFIGKGAKFTELRHELLRFPYGKHDDIIMTLALIITQLVKAPVKREKRMEKHGWRTMRMTGMAPANWRVA